MDREKLKMVAGYYFKDNLGAEPDTLTFDYEDDDVREYSIEATLGGRKFHLWMCAGANLIELTEKWHKGTFDDAAALAGLDRNLNNLNEA